MLDHASVSRQHAILCYQTDSNKWVIVDQGSAHGTSVNGRSTVKVKMLLEVAHNIMLSQENCPAVVNECCDPTPTAAQMCCAWTRITNLKHRHLTVQLPAKSACALQGVPAQVVLGAKVLFGASTRQYVLQHQSNKQGHLKRSADDDNMQPRKQARLGNDHAELDRSDALPLKGQFADVITSELRPAQTAASPSNPAPAKAQQEAPARTKPDFQKFVSSHLKRPAVGQAGSLYDRLPPEKQTKPMQ